MIGPKLAFSERLHADKYRLEGESFREAMGRVASALTDDDQGYQEFREILLGQRFLPAGRVQSAIGSIRGVTPYNCFVSGTIEDSYVDGHGSIMERAHEAAKTMRMGGGIGYDFTTLRPKGSLIKKRGGHSSGPVSFMEIYDAVCRCTASAGDRRGAQMGVMRVDHPDIEEFIHVKQNEDKLRGFNISIAVTDHFMECLANEKPFPLQWGGEVHREINPRSLWETIMRSTWDWAEPGVLFIDTINRMNNLYYCEEIAATNPCGEQPLPPYGACLLGSMNLVKFLHRIGINRYEFDWDLFGEDIHTVIPAMDAVVDRAEYPLFEQEKEAKSKRRMGIGVTGVANCIEALGYPYGHDDFLGQLDQILARLTREAYLTSADLAVKRGAFPLYDPSSYMGGQFVQTLDQDVQDRVAAVGIRNSHLTSIAPTGTISFTADYVSSGLEPVLEYEATRLVLMPDGQEEVEVSDYGWRELGVKGKLAAEVTADEHVSVLAIAYKHVDSAVSKTCTVSPDMPWEDFENIYLRAWHEGCKGVTTFNPGGKRKGIIKKKTEDKPAACHITEEGRRECE
jgi:ribonucleoside-diphosphate reductase alpha chain